MANLYPSPSLYPSPTQYLGPESTATGVLVLSGNAPSGRITG